LWHWNMQDVTVERDVHFAKRPQNRKCRKSD